MSCVSVRVQQQSLQSIASYKSIERFSFPAMLLLLLLWQRLDLNLIHDLSFHLLKVTHQH